MNTSFWKKSYRFWRYDRSPTKYTSKYISKMRINANFLYTVFSTNVLNFFDIFISLFYTITYKCKQVKNWSNIAYNSEENEKWVFTVIWLVNYMRKSVWFQLTWIFINIYTWLSTSKYVYWNTISMLVKQPLFPRYTEVGGGIRQLLYS